MPACSTCICAVARQGSGAAERLTDAFVRLWRFHVAGKARLVIEWLRETGQQFLEQKVVVTLDGSLNHSLDAMVARDECRIHRSHPRTASLGRIGLLREPLAPTRQPRVKRRRILKQVAQRRFGSHLSGRLA